jgi:hypothetical protein
MAVYKKNGKWFADWRDRNGARKRKSFAKKEDAQVYALDMLNRKLVAEGKVRPTRKARQFSARGQRRTAATNTAAPRRSNSRTPSRAATSNTSTR